MIKPNLGLGDRLIRLLVASVCFYLGLFPYANSALGLGLMIAGSISFVTALVGFCGLYRLLGIRTNQTHESL